MAQAAGATRPTTSDAVFDLRVLGPVTVRHPSDPVAHSRVTQPRHLALVCYLALARPRGLHERDTLLALLWPEHSEARGRRALRNALYAARRSLVPAAIVSVGGHLIGLDPSIVRLDAVNLERGLLDAFDLTHEPLQGLHVAGAPEFDEWMTAERDRLRRLLARLERSNGHVAELAPPRVAVVESRRPHSQDAYALYTRGHFLFLRSAHGGPPQDLHRSREYFERALQADATYAPAVAGLANFHAVAARRGIITPFADTFARAIELSREALALDNTLAAPHVHLAVQALYLDDDWDAAGREFSTAVQKDPDYAEGHRFYGVWLGMVGRDDEALREMEEAARLEPDIPHVMSSLSAARLAVGDRAGAEDALRRTLEIEPGHVPARERLVRLLEDGERFIEAVEERLRAPALAGAEELHQAFVSAGADGYRHVLTGRLREQAAALEARLSGRQPHTVNDIFSPPEVRLATLLARLGEWSRVRAWRLQATAARPAMARWFESVPELRRG